MGFFDAITDLITGATDQIEGVKGAVGDIANHEVVQSLKDSAADLGTKTEEVTGSLNEQAQGVADSVKEKLNTK